MSCDVSWAAWQEANPYNPQFPLGRLPLELKEHIVVLVDEQDEAYRKRSRTRDSTTRFSSVWFYGRGLYALLFCNSELRELASRILYSNLTLRMSKSPSFPFVILPRYVSFIRSVTLSSGTSESSFPSALCVALPQLPQLRKVILREFPSWIPNFFQKHGHHPLTLIGPQIFQLEIGSWLLNGDCGRPLILDCLGLFSGLTSLKMTTVRVRRTLLKAINSLQHLKTLEIDTMSFDLLPGSVWRKGKTLISVSIKTQEAGWTWTIELWNWIRSFGDQLEVLTLTNESYMDELPALLDIKEIYFPSLRRLSLEFAAVDTGRELKLFCTSPLLYLSLPCLHLWSTPFSTSSTQGFVVPGLVKMVDRIRILEERFFKDTMGGLMCLHETKRAVQNFCDTHGWMFQFWNDVFPTTGETELFHGANFSDGRKKWIDEYNCILEFGLRSVARMAYLPDSRASVELSEALEGLRKLQERDEE